MIYYGSGDPNQHPSHRAISGKPLWGFTRPKLLCILWFNFLISKVRSYFQVLITLVGLLKIPELPVCSPLVHSVLKTLGQWETDLKNRLEKFDSAPANYIPGVYVEPSFGGSVTIVKYHIVMDPANTPFMWVFFNYVIFNFTFLFGFKQTAVYRNATWKSVNRSLVGNCIVCGTHGNCHINGSKKP